MESTGMLLLQILVDWFQQNVSSGNRVVFMLPMYYLQRGRIAEALHAYTGAKDSFQGGQGNYSSVSSMSSPA